MRFKRPDQRGETLVEVVMALGILSLVLVSTYALATGSFRLGRGAGQRTQAVNYLQEQAEALRTYRDQQSTWAVFTAGMAPYVPAGTFCMTQVATPPSTVKLWQPVASSNAACTKDGVTMTIAPTPLGALADQYTYKLKATWKNGPSDENVTLNTRLVKLR